MTGKKTYREQGRALFLSALMVLSVVAGTAALAGTASAAPTVSVTADNTVQPGEQTTITIEGTETGEVSVSGEVGGWIVNSTSPSGFSTFPSSADTPYTSQSGDTWGHIFSGPGDNTWELTVTAPQQNGTYNFTAEVVNGSDATETENFSIEVADSTQSPDQGGQDGQDTQDAPDPGEPEVIGVSEYQGDFTVAFDRPVVNASSGNDIDAVDNHFIIYARQAGEGNTVRANVSGDALTVGPNNARFEIPESAHGLGDISPAGEVDIYIGNTSDARGVSGANSTTPGNVSADLSSAVLFEDDNAHTSRNIAQRIFQGQPVSFQAVEDNTDITLENVETGELILTGSTGVNSREIVFESDNLESGSTYRLTFNENEDIETEKYFNVTSLRMSASLDEDGTLFEHNEEVELTVSGESIRGNSGVAVDVVGPTDDDDEDSSRYDLTQFNNRGEFEETYNFGLALAAGDYEVTVTDVATGVDVSAGEFSVDTFPEADSASFDGGVFEEERGDVVEIPISLSNSEEGAQATVSIGNFGDTEYVTNVTVADEDGDGEVVLEWNTYMSGTGMQDYIFTAQGEDNITAFGGESGGFVEAVRQDLDGDGNVTDDTSLEFAGNGILDPASYDLAVVANDEDQAELLNSGNFNFSEIDADGVGAVRINQRSTESSDVWVVPSDKKDQVDFEFIDENTDNTEDAIDGNLTQSDLVASDELIVHQLSASGLEGVFKNRTNNGANATSAYLSAVDVGVFNASFSEEEPGPNAQRERFDLNTDNTVVIPDYANDTYYVAVDLAGVSDDVLEDDIIYNASFTFEGYESVGPPIGGEGEGTVSSVWTYELAEATLDTNADDEVVIRNQAGQTIRGDTNVAPGTELGLRVNSQSDSSPFLTTLNTHVTEDRTFAATGDFSERGSNINFTVTVRRGGSAISDQYSGMILSQATATVTFSDQAVAEGNQEVVVDSTTLSDGGFIAIHEGSASGDVIGTSGFLEAGQHSNVRVDLDSPINETTTLVAMPHLDDNSNNLYDFPEADAPYTANGSAVTDSASVSLDSATPEPTATATATPEPTATATPEPTATATPEPTATATPEPTETQADDGDESTPEPTTTGDGPGFGVAVSLIALLAAALLTARRRD